MLLCGGTTQTRQGTRRAAHGRSSERIKPTEDNWWENLACCSGGKYNLLGLRWMAVGGGRWGNGQVERFGVGIGYIKGVSQIHLKCVTLPVKAVLDEGCRELGTVEEIRGCDA